MFSIYCGMPGSYVGAGKKIKIYEGGCAKYSIPPPQDLKWNSQTLGLTIVMVICSPKSAESREGYSIRDPEGGGNGIHIFLFFADPPHILFFRQPPHIFFFHSAHPPQDLKWNSPDQVLTKIRPSIPGRGSECWFLLLKQKWYPYYACLGNELDKNVCIFLFQ